MVVAAESTGMCPRCGGDISTQVLRAERFACVYCGWRDYGEDAGVSWGEGRVLRLRYLGTNPQLVRFPPLAALMVPDDGTVVQPRLELRIACPHCRALDVLSVMDRCGWSLERWRCGGGHELRLHLVGREEVVGWS